MNRQMFAISVVPAEGENEYKALAGLLAGVIEDCCYNAPDVPMDVTRENGLGLVSVRTIPADTIKEEEPPVDLPF